MMILTTATAVLEPAQPSSLACFVNWSCAHMRSFAPASRMLCCRYVVRALMTHIWMMKKNNKLPRSSLCAP